MSNEQNNPCLGVSGLLGVLFVGLKLTGFIDWSWWWVTSPFWLPFAIATVVVIPLACIYGVVKK